MDDTVYEFLLNSFIGLGSLHDNELKWRIANGNCYKVTKIGLAFTNEINLLLVEIYCPKITDVRMESVMISENGMTAPYMLKIIFDFSWIFFELQNQFFKIIIFSAYLITVLLNLEIIFNCLI